MTGEPRSFSLNDGGPFYQVMRRLRLIRGSGMISGPVLALFAWLPIVVGEAARVVLGMAPDPTLTDLSMHVRLLVALPLVLFSERLVEPAAASSIRSLYVTNVCDASALDDIVARGERLRDAWLPEALLASLAFIGGQLALWHVFGATGVFHGATGAGAFSFPRMWYVVIALPLAQFVMLRWMWRWTIWSLMLAHIARQPLRTLATHPDKAAGLACLARPVAGCGAFACAIGSVLASAWGTQILAGRTTVEAELPALVAFLLIVVAVAVAPLLLFCGHLYRGRRRAIAQYGDFASRYTCDFHDKWIVHATPESPLGAQDIQALNDLGGAYNVVVTTRFFVFGPSTLMPLWFGAILPMVPLFASILSVEHVLKRILGTLLGGLPL
ncbi:MAG TPA: hypothetical protein VMJ10_15320 [Kofleriaceae bacterium]|nr:hypothetical protein [Kofleriaceae bacterium]